MNFLYPTAFSSWGDGERAAIDRVMASGRFTQGAEVAAFEKEFAAWHDRRYGIMVNSGSSANLIVVAALRHLGLCKPETTALVPAIAWSTTYAPLVQHGFDLQLIDVDDSWNANPSAQIPLADDTSLVVGCSILGIPADLERWATIADSLRAVFIEDNCESLGAVRDGRKTGTHGLMSTHSLYYSHQISAIEGGVILTDDADCAEACRMLRAHGWTRDIRRGSLSFSTEYEFIGMGYNVRGLELHAAIAREQLKRLPEMIEARRRNFDYFRDKAQEARLPIDLPTIHGNPSPFGLHFTLRDGTRRQALAEALRAAGIDCRLPTGGSFRKHPSGLRWASQRTPNADRTHELGMFLGNGPIDLTEKIDWAIEIMGTVLNRSNHSDRQEG